MLNLLPDDVEKMVAVLQSEDAVTGFQKLVAEALRGKPLEVIVGTLKMMEQAGPALARVFTQTSRSLLQMPIHRLVGLVNDASPVAEASKPAAKPGVSAKRKRALAIQGRYIGLLRHTKAGPGRDRIKKIAEAKGAAAAIAEIERQRKVVAAVAAKLRRKR